MGSDFCFFNFDKRASDESMVFITFAHSAFVFFAVGEHFVRSMKQNPYSFKVSEIASISSFIVTERFKIVSFDKDNSTDLSLSSKDKESTLS